MLIKEKQTKLEQLQDYEQKKKKIKNRADKGAPSFYRFVYPKVKAGNGVRGALSHVHFTLDTISGFCYVLDL